MPHFLRRLAVVVTCLALAVLAGVFAGNVQAQAGTTLAFACPSREIIVVESVGGVIPIPAPLWSAEVRHPDSGERYVVEDWSLLQQADDWQLTTWRDYESATGAPLLQLRFNAGGGDADSIVVLVYEVDADTVAPAIWSYDHLFENADSEAAQHPNCGWYTMARADLDSWLSEVTAAGQPEPETGHYIIVNGRVYR